MKELRKRIDNVVQEFKRLTNVECFFVFKQEDEGEPMGAANFCVDVCASEVGKYLCSEKRDILIRSACFKQHAVFSPCHCGLAEIVAPLFNRDELLGTFVAICRPNCGTEADGLACEGVKYGISPDRWYENLKDIKAVDTERIEVMTALLDSLVGLNFGVACRSPESGESDTPYAFIGENINYEECSDYDYWKEESAPIIDTGRGIISQMQTDDTAAAMNLIKSIVHQMYKCIRSGRFVEAKGHLKSLCCLDESDEDFDAQLFDAALCVVIVCIDMQEISPKSGEIYELCRGALHEILNGENTSDLQRAHNLLLDGLSNIYCMKSTENSEVVNRIAKYVESNFDKQISLTELSRKMNISLGYASRLFKQQMGVNFKWYVIETRMHHAYKLLCESEEKLPITEIARRSGYDNIRAFYAMFSKFYGISCSQMRKKFGKGPLFK